MVAEENVLSDLIAAYDKAKASLNFKGAKEYSKKIAVYYFTDGKHEASLQYLHEYLGLISNSTDPSERVEANKLIGKCYKFTGELSEAEEYFITALEEANHINDDLLRAEIQVDLGSLYKDMNLLSLGLSFLEEAIDIYQNKLILSDGTIAANHYWSYQAAVNNLANILANYGQPYKACEIISEAIKFKLNEGKDYLNIARLYSNLGVAYVQVDLEKADEQYKKALDYALQSNNPQVIAGVYNNIADSFERKNELSSALDYYKKAATILQDNGINLFLTQVQNNIAIVFMKLGDYDRAIETIQTILQMPAETQDATQLSNTYKTLSDVYKAKGQYKEALRYLDVYNEKNEQKYKREIIRQAKDVSGRVDRLARRLRINSESQMLQYGNPSASLAKFIGISPAIRRVLELALLAATSNSTNVLITGESGVGKEVLARIIHEGGKASKGEFITANCGAIPNSLAESEFFGHVKGAYTGAAYSRSGLFELADKGTLFLDEIADTNLDIQSKLLRALESRQVFRVGSNKPIGVNIRVISATNRDIKAMVDSGLFRLDLYYRLNTIEIVIPPLRERAEDIEPLFDFFVAHFSNKMGKKVPQYDQNLINYLSEYDFPGNVRELKNMVERALILTSNNVLSPACFPLGTKTQERDFSEESVDVAQRLASVESRYIVQVYNGCGRNKALTARKLGISYPTLKRKLKSLGF